MMYAIAEIPFLEPSGKVAFLFSAIASIAKYDIYNAFSKRQPEYIQHKSNKLQ